MNDLACSEQLQRCIGKNLDKAEIVTPDILALIHELEVQNEELRQGRRELDNSTRTYSGLYHFAPIAYLCTDTDGIIVNSNLMTSVMLGLPEKDLVGQGFFRFIHPADIKYYFALVREAFEIKGGRRSGEIRLLGPGGKLFYARVDLNVSIDDLGRMTELRIAFVDISEQKNTEEKLKKHAEKLERSNLELQDFAFTASHDLNEPLRKIQAFGEQLQRKFAPALGGEGLELVERMRRATKRLQDMIGGLLDYSRVVAARDGFVAVDFNLLVRDVLSDLEWQIDLKGATVTLDELPTLEADPDQMRRLFQNLISNALKFQGKEPILIRVFSMPCEVQKDEPQFRQIFIEDNGIGFEQIHAERIFSLFERLHRRSVYEGTGMGLAICRRIVERHGGAITARSIPGKGSTFIIRLPCGQRKIGGLEPSF